MSDPGFTQRCLLLQRRLRWYLFSSAAIPLMALVLLVLRSGDNQNAQLLTILVTSLALSIAFFAHQKLEASLSQLAAILSPDSAKKKMAE
jgi:hypothetical protein